MGMEVCLSVFSIHIENPVDIRQLLIAASVFFCINLFQLLVRSSSLRSTASANTIKWSLMRKTSLFPAVFFAKLDMVELIEASLQVPKKYDFQGEWLNSSWFLYGTQDMFLTIFAIGSAVLAIHGVVNLK